MLNEMSKQVKCSLCNQSKWMETRYFIENLSIYKVITIEELNKVYLCRYCRILKKTNEGLKSTEEYKRIKRQLQEEIDILIKRGATNTIAQQNCRANIEGIFNQEHITTGYQLVVNNGKIIGIVLKDFPIWHDIFFEIKWKGR